jgi:hypothetical protein
MQSRDVRSYSAHSQLSSFFLLFLRIFYYSSTTTEKKPPHLSPQSRFPDFCSREGTVGRHASAEGRAACRIIYACKPMARGRRGPHADRTRQSDIKLDVRLPAVIASRPPATLLEALNRARAALKCAHARAPAAARPA